MSTQIVQTNVAVTLPPAPSQLQRTGAFISQGGTTKAAGTLTLLTSPADLTPILTAPDAIGALSWLSGVATAVVPTTTISSATYDGTSGLVTLTDAADIGLAPGDLVYVTGTTGTGSNASAEGTFTCLAGTTGDTVIYKIATGLTMTLTGGDVYATHGVAAGKTWITTIAGAVPAAYNGIYTATAVDATSFTYALASDGGTTPATGSPTYTARNVDELTAMATTFFAQGSNQAVYVLELGQGEPAAGVTALSAFIIANPGVQYAFLVPANWDGESSYKTFLNNYTSPTAKLYFFTTSTVSTYSAYSDLLKCALILVPAPGTPLTEFTCAMPFYRVLSYAPSSSNQVPQLGFSFAYGVTPWSGLGIQSTLAAMKASGVNYIYTGAEGGLSNTILEWGTTMDGQQFNFWYSVDWMQINQDLNISNAVINGSNNPAAPLYDNQQGVNRLQAVARDTCVTAVSYGLALGNVVTTQLSQAQFAANVNAGLYAGQVVVNAVPFDNWSELNPSAYRIGQYGGLSVYYAPQLGFQQIIININATETV